MKNTTWGALAVPVTLIAILFSACQNEKATNPTEKATDKVHSYDATTEKTTEKTGGLMVSGDKDFTFGPSVSKSPANNIHHYFDSLMRFSIPEPPLLGKAEFDNVAHSDFSEMAKATGGNFILVRQATEVAKTAARIIDENLKRGTDVLFMVDQTASMSDDLENIKLGMKAIVQSLKKQRDIRCGMAFYGDKIEDKNWFRKTPFTYNFDTLENYIQHLTAIGGGDLPESVYDGFFEAVSTMNVDEKRKLMVMIIGDAHSLDSTRSTYSLQDVLAFCKKRDVHINLYPMLLATNDDRIEETKPVYADLIYSLYPNPTRGDVHFKTNRAGFYDYEIINQAGSIVKNGSLTGPETSINIAMLSNGLYSIRLIDVESRHTESHKVVLQK